jgi:hypothetical protein
MIANVEYSLPRRPYAIQYNVCRYLPLPAWLPEVAPFASDAGIPTVIERVTFGQLLAGIDPLDDSCIPQPCLLPSSPSASLSRISTRVDRSMISSNKYSGTCAISLPSP